MKDLLHFRLAHTYIELPLKLFFVSWQCFHCSFLNKFENDFYLICLHLEWRPFARFFDSICLLLLSWIIFCGDGFDVGASKIWLRTGITYVGGVKWSFFREATSFFNIFPFFNFPILFQSCFKFLLYLIYLIYIVLVLITNNLLCNCLSTKIQGIVFFSDIDFLWFRMLPPNATSK